MRCLSIYVGTHPPFLSFFLLNTDKIVICTIWRAFPGNFTENLIEKKKRWPVYHLKFVSSPPEKNFTIHFDIFLNLHHVKGAEVKNTHTTHFRRKTAVCVFFTLAGFRVGIFVTPITGGVRNFFLTTATLTLNTRNTYSLLSPTLVWRCVSFVPPLYWYPVCLCTHKLMLRQKEEKKKNGISTKFKPKHRDRFVRLNPSK